MSQQPPFSRSRHGRTVTCASGIIFGTLLLTMAVGCNNLTAQNLNSEGVRLHQQARFEDALHQFREAVWADPEDPDGYYNLAATYHRMGLRDNRQADLDQAEQYYHMCLDKDENHVDCYRGLTVLLGEQGRKEDAFRLLEGWVDKSPDLADPKIELARLFDEYGDKAAAKENLIEALSVESDNARALAALGKIREELGDPRAALRNYQRSYSHNPMQPQVASRISALKSQMGPVNSINAPAGGTRLVDREPEPLR